MKLLRFLTLVSFWAILSSSNVFAQDKLDATIVSDLNKITQYAIGVSDERHFKGAMSMYDFLVESGVEIQDYEVVVKGKIVSKLTKGSELEEFFQKYKGKVQVSICSVAMEKLGVSKGELIDGMDPVPTWSVRILQLQAKGYNVLTY